MALGNLATTNLLLGIMAAVSVLEGLLVIGMAVGGWMVYRRVMTVVNDLEHRHVAPVMARVNAILDDVKVVSTTVKTETERFDSAIHRTMDRVDETTHRVHENVRGKANRAVGFVIGLRRAVEHFARARPKETAEKTY